MFLYGLVEGKEIELSIDKWDNKRSGQQNRYYWFYLHLIEEETGNEALDVHEMAKRMFLPPKFIKCFGKEIKIPKSTTKLNKLEMSDYLSKIERWSGIPLPDPQTIKL